MVDQITEFIQHLKADSHISASTIDAYQSDLSRFFAYLDLGNHSFPPQYPDGKAFYRFLEHEKKLGLKPSTLHRRRVTLKRYAEFLSRHGRLDQSVVAEIAGWQHDLWAKIAQGEAGYLTDAEVERLYAAIEEEERPRSIRDRLIISLILETGLSIGALVDLNLADVSQDSKTIRLDGSPEGWHPLGTSSDYLIEYLAASRPELTQSVKEEALFVSQMGGRITRQGVWQVIRAWGINAGLSTPLSPRVLRHTAVKRMLDQGRSIEKIGELLGHTNRHSTQALVRKINKSIKPRRMNRR